MGRGMIFLLTLALVTACGPSNNQSCQLIFSNERQVIGTRCGPNEVVVGMSGSTLACSQVSALCPKAP